MLRDDENTETGETTYMVGREIISRTRVLRLWLGLSRPKLVLPKSEPREHAQKGEGILRQPPLPESSETAEAADGNRSCPLLD
jgi:hypothetical protein